MDRELLLVLYKRQAKIIFYYLIKQGCQREEAEDIVQDSFIKAIEYMDGVEASKLSSWLFTVAMNNYRNRIKRRSKIGQLSIDEDGFYNRISEDEEVSEGLLREERRRVVKNCLTALKEDFRTILILKYEMELSYKEIGRLLGASEDTVKTWLYRARNEFKKVWRENYE